MGSTFYNIAKILIMNTIIQSKFSKKGMLLASLLFLVMFGLANDNVKSESEVTDGTEVLGIWEGDNHQERFEIYKKGDLYYGKIVWTAYEDIKGIEGRGLLDLNNPDTTKRDQSLIGLEILLDFKYKGNGVYSSGKVYDPGSGNTYKCKIKVDGDFAKIRGYILMPLLGRTETAFRIK